MQIIPHPYPIIRPPDRHESQTNTNEGDNQEVSGDNSMLNEKSHVPNYARLQKCYLPWQSCHYKKQANQRYLLINRQDIASWNCNEAL